jgi:hypothetical protein
MSDQPAFRIISICLVFCVFSCGRHPASPLMEESETEAGQSLDWWARVRTYPDGHFYTENYARAFSDLQTETGVTTQRSGPWEPIGPKNIGGRTLCLAVNPSDTSILWAGSASGGLWKSTSGGRGASAWTWVSTGFPVLGVSTIALDPQNPQVMYVGTGEVYNRANSMPNVAVRTTRGTYGIGILKSTNGGGDWVQSLDWTYGEMKGVQDIKINPIRPATVYAATSEGLYRSYNAGASWQQVDNIKMAVDIEINPIDTGKIYVTHGSFEDDAISGLYRSVNGGNSFAKMTNGLPVSYSGKALLGACLSQPNVMYASIGDETQQHGLYKTTDGGDSWTLISSENVSTYQGWYSHDVSVNPTDPDQVIWTGLDAWKSNDGGLSFVHKTSWNKWYFGQVPAGGPEGPYDYVHADIHRAYWQPSDPSKIYVVSDGGIFVSRSAGESWEGLNGSYQTTQFYANFGNSASNPNFGIGGMQDNATALFTGTTNWYRVLGGDGCCAAVNPQNDQLVFGSSQYLNIGKSTDGGLHFANINPAGTAGENACFNGPFELAPSDPQTMYAGAQSIFRSINGGGSWTNVTGGPVNGTNLILTIAVNPQASNKLFFSTVPPGAGTAHVYRLTVGSGPATLLTGLPDRICMDIALHPVSPDTVYAVFSGFNTPHVWRSADNGNSWTSIDNGLPDVPANCFMIDPLNPTHLFLGNDLGVWTSENSGLSWTLLSNCAPYAMQAMHISITNVGRKLRVATHGLGVWQTGLDQLLPGTEPNTSITWQIGPNPASGQVRIQVEPGRETTLDFQLYDQSGRLIRDTGEKTYGAGFQWYSMDIRNLPAGVYRMVMLENGQRVSKFQAVKNLVIANR